MSPNSHTAERSFAENFRLFGPGDPEKDNLYSGLANLAAAITQIQRTLAFIDQRLSHIEQKID